MPQDLTNDKSTLVQLMAWCRQATSHYLNRCWPRYLTPYGVTRPQGVKAMRHEQKWQTFCRQYFQMDFFLNENVTSHYLNQWWPNCVRWCGITGPQWIIAQGTCANSVLNNVLADGLASLFANMMTSSNGNIFRVTDHLCGEFTGQRWITRKRPVMRSFDVFFDLCPHKRLSKQSWGWWCETPSGSLWRHCNGSWKSHQLIRHCWWFGKLSDDLFKIIRHIVWKTFVNYLNLNVWWFFFKKSDNFFQNVWWFAQNHQIYCLMFLKKIMNTVGYSIQKFNSKLWCLVSLECPNSQLTLQ